jgi:hypothetical protein
MGIPLETPRNWVEFSLDDRALAVMKFLVSVVGIAITLAPSVASAEEPSARCYLMSWDSLTRTAPLPAQVRQWAEARCSIHTAAELAQLNAILRLDRLRSGTPPTRDLRFVVDIQRGDGSSESYYADRFGLMSADMKRWRKLGSGFRREIDSFVRPRSSKSSNHAMQRTAGRVDV